MFFADPKRIAGNHQASKAAAGRNKLKQKTGDYESLTRVGWFSIPRVGRNKPFHQGHAYDTD
jgi:hypothetical protein